MSTPPARDFARFKKPIVAAVLLALSLLICGARLHTYDEPFERDITTYAVIAHEMLQGRPLYSDMWDLKPPAVFVTYALSEVIAGYGPASIYLLGVSAAILTLFAVYFAGSFYGGAKCGICAALLWAIVCSDLYLQANQPNTEVFINALLAASFAAFLKLRADAFGARRVLGIAILLALASLFKQVTLAVFLGLACAHFWLPTEASTDEQSAAPSTQRRVTALQIVVMFTVVVAAWLSVIFYFVATGRGEVFYQTLVVIGKLYAGNPIQNLIGGLAPAKLFPPLLFWTIPLWLALFCGAILNFRQKRETRAWLLLLGYLVGTQIAVALPGKFQPHYYQLWLPPLCIGAAWSLNSIASALSQVFRKPSRVLQLAPGGVLLALLLCREAPFFALSSDEWSRRKYGEFFIRERKLARKVDALLEPHETFYEWGRETGLYFQTRRRPPAGVLINYPLYQNPLMENFSRKVIADLSRAQPEMLVVCTGYPLDGPVIQWLGPRYEFFPGNHQRGKFILLARRGGALEERLRVGLQREP